METPHHRLLQNNSCFLGHVTPKLAPIPLVLYYKLCANTLSMIIYLFLETRLTVPNHIGISDCTNADLLFSQAGNKTTGNCAALSWTWMLMRILINYVSTKKTCILHFTVIFTHISLYALFVTPLHNIISSLLKDYYIYFMRKDIEWYFPRLLDYDG